MKIPNPQSATLPNAEVLHFLTTRPPRAPDRAVGSYPPTSSAGHATIRRELHTYFSHTVPWTQTQADLFQAEHYLDPKNDADEDQVYPTTTSSRSGRDGWVRTLMARLAPYELTKGEVLMVVNLGLGMEDFEARMPPRLRGGGDGVRSAEEQRVCDEWVLGAVCEELEQRFGQEEIRGILDAVGEVVREAGGGGGEGRGGGQGGSGG